MKASSKVRRGARACWLRWGLWVALLAIAGCAGERAPTKAPDGYTTTSDPGSPAPHAEEQGAYPASPSPPSYWSEGDTRESAASTPPPGGSKGAATPQSAAEPQRGASASRDAPMKSSDAEGPSARPGLGTEWGETRSSYVRDVRFTRSQGDRPFAMATMNYNDRRGVEALAAHVANRTSGRDFVAGGGAITVEIHDENGEPLEAVKLGERTLVVGHPGDRYSIVLMNHTDHRFEAVATVDGLDVINGRPGTLQNRGYVLMPFASLTIDGFRQSQDAVAAFRFASVAESYAARTGSARNVGVIGVAFFAEGGDSFQPYTGRELYLRDTAIPFPASDPHYARPPR